MNTNTFGLTINASNNAYKLVEQSDYVDVVDVSVKLENNRQISKDYFLVTMH